MTEARDRSHYRTRKLALDDEGRESDVAALSAGERVAMVWALTADAWAFKDGKWDEQRVRRDVVSTRRGRR